MQLTISISLDNAAFEDNAEEVATILAKVAERVGSPPAPGGGMLLDSNGNSCGDWLVRDEEG